MAWRGLSQFHPGWAGCCKTSPLPNSLSSHLLIDIGVVLCRLLPQLEESITHRVSEIQFWSSVCTQHQATGERGHDVQVPTQGIQHRWDGQWLTQPTCSQQNFHLSASMLESLFKIPCPNQASCCPSQPYLKQCFRKLRANLPAWYSAPSMRDGSISVSSISTASSLSRFPSKLRSLMLAEPGWGRPIAWPAH